MPASVPYVGVDLSIGACFHSMDSLLPKNPTLQAQVQIPRRTHWHGELGQSRQKMGVEPYLATLLSVLRAGSK
jgi:hypothetical protein